MRAVLRSFALWLLIALHGASAAQDLDAAALAAAIERARAEQVDVLAPAAFAAAVAAQESAARDAQRGRNAERIEARLAEAEAALRRAGDSAEAARKLLGTTIKAREDALLAEAPQFASEAWVKAAGRFEQAMRENEKGDLRDAERRAAEAEVLLRDAELLAIKGSVLNEARTLIAQAEQAKVEKRAPRTMEAARRHLAEAEREIHRSRYDLATAHRLAGQASYEARHASYLAGLIGRVLDEEDDGQGGLEALILSWEAPLERLAQQMELSAQFDAGLDGPLKELSEHTRHQAQEARRLRLELADREEQIEALEAEVQRLEARLGGVSEERIALQRRVDAQERVRASLRAIEAAFTADEARVYRQGDDVVISLLGIRFPSGRASIDAGSAALMRKVQRALELFANASVSVEGHTDASGSDSTNLILSQDRADAVKQYLVSTFGLNPERVSSVGYGEARPVATNETAPGRARNRRIDLILHLRE